MLLEPVEGTRLAVDGRSCSMGRSSMPSAGDVKRLASMARPQASGVNASTSSPSNSVSRRRVILSSSAPWPSVGTPSTHHVASTSMSTPMGASVAHSNSVHPESGSAR